MTVRNTTARTFLLGACVVPAFILSAQTTQAQVGEGQARCLLLGPIVISSYLEFMGKIAQKKTDKLDSRADNLLDLVKLYDGLGCDAARLNAAVECLSTAILDRQRKTPIAEIAQSCMREAGMPVR